MTRSARTHVVLALALILGTPALADDHRLTHEQAVDISEQMQDNEVRLVSPGTGDTTRRRYAPTAGTAFASATVSTIEMTQTMQGNAMPPTAIPPSRIVTDTTVASVAPGGDYVLRSTIRQAGLAPGARPNAPMARAMDISLKALEGYTYSRTFNDRGQLLETSIDDEQAADPMVEQQLAQLASVDTIVPLPEEPIGLGAVWQHKREIVTSGMRTSTLSVYTLEAVRSESLILAVQVHSIIPEQAMQNDQLPPGVVMRLTESDSDGSARITADSSTGLPRTISLAQTINMTVEMTMQGQSVTTVQTLDSRIEAEPVPVVTKENP